MRLSRVLLAVVSMVATATVGLVGPRPAAALGGTYVALGDSYASGPLIPGYEQPFGCLRSTNNYAHLLSRQLKIALRDRTCAGAQTDDMFHEQGVTPGPNPAQFDALDTSTALVTMQIGGNDIGFGNIAEACFAPIPTGTPCQDTFVVGGQDIFSQRVENARPEVMAAIAGAKTRAPNARILVLGYPSIVPEKDGLATSLCWPQLPISPADIPWIRTKVKELNAMIASSAAANGVQYVDIYGPSVGKDACALPILRWVEPLVIVGPAAPVHPNITGMLGITTVLRRAIG